MTSWNQQQAYNKYLPETNFQNQMQYANAKSGAQRGDTATQMGAMNQIEGGASSLIGGAYNGLTSFLKNQNGVQA